MRDGCETIGEILCARGGLQRDLKRNAKRHRRLNQENSRRLEYEVLETRQVLAALFPTYVDGTFTLGDANAAIPYALEDTFKLATNPSASKTIYLDFNGHHSVNNSWNHDIVFEPYDRDGNPSVFSDAELIEIQRIFQNVAEDFAPFTVNVTTIEPDIEMLRKTGAGDNEYGIRVVHTQPTPEFGGFGGVAFLNSFDDSIDNPCFAINKGVNVGAMTISHEVGHTLGLSHDGLNSQAYHPGTGGSGPVSWGPIMGAPFSANVTQWSRGEYVGSTTTQDDLAIITKPANGFGFKADDHGNTRPTATNLEFTSSSTVFDWGFITSPDDVDVFKFTAGAGTAQFQIDAFRENPNLDILAQILDADGNVVATSNPADDVNASFDLTLDAGTYYLTIDGVGSDNNENTDYGSMGFYTIEGNVVPAGPSVIGESGTLTDLTDAWKTVTFQNTFNNPVVVAGTPSRNGGDPITIRVRNVTSSSFEIRVDEWDYRDGRHGRESVSYLVVESGEHQLDNGTVIKAGATTSNHRWSQVTFENTDLQYLGQPIVFAQVASVVEQDAAIARIRNATGNGFQLRIQEEQASDFVHAAETVHYVSIGPGMGVQSGLLFEAAMTGNEVTHLPYFVNFAQDFDTAPSFFAAMQTYNGGDPATVRYRSLNADRARIYLEEERSFDAEIRHNPEIVGYLAIEAGSLSVSPQPPGNMPLAFRQEYQNGNDPERLAAAIAIQRSWGEESQPLDCAHGDHHGGCGCAGCLSSLLTDDQFSNFLFGQPGVDRLDGISNGDETATFPASRLDVIGSTAELAGSIKSMDRSMADQDWTAEDRDPQAIDEVAAEWMKVIAANPAL